MDDFSPSLLPDVAQLRDNASFLSRHLMDQSLLLASLTSKAGAIQALELERQQIHKSHNRLLENASLVPSQVQVITDEIDKTKREIERETWENLSLSEAVLSCDARPDLAGKELKRLRKALSARNSVITSLQESIAKVKSSSAHISQSIAAAETEVTATVELLKGSGETTELAAILAQNRTLRRAIANSERKAVKLGERIDRYRRHVRKRPEATSQIPDSECKTIVEKKPKLSEIAIATIEGQQTPMNIATQPVISTPSLDISTEENTVIPPPVPVSSTSEPYENYQFIPLFRPPPIAAKTVFEKYRISEDPKDSYFVPRAANSEEPELAVLKGELKMAVEMYSAQTECPREQVDIVGNALRAVKDKEAAVCLVLRTLAKLSKVLSVSDANYLLQVVFSPFDERTFAAILPYAASDFYNRRLEGARNQWSSEAPGTTTTLQGLWVRLIAQSDWPAGVRRLCGLLFRHCNAHVLKVAEDCVKGSSSLRERLGFVSLLADCDCIADEEIYRLVLTASHWSLADRVWTLKLISMRKGPSFTHTFLTHHIAPIFTKTQAGDEARLFFIKSVFVALKTMQGHESYKEVKAHWEEVLAAVASGVKLQHTEVFTQLEKDTANKALEKVRTRAK